MIKQQWKSWPVIIVIPTIVTATIVTCTTKIVVMPSNTTMVTSYIHNNYNDGHDDKRL